jgi:hypothetical protein
MMTNTSRYDPQRFRHLLTILPAQPGVPSTEGGRKQEAIGWQAVEHQENFGTADSSWLSKEYGGPRRWVDADIQAAQEVQLAAVRLKPRPVQSRKTEFAVLGVAALLALAWVFSSVKFVGGVRDPAIQSAAAAASLASLASPSGLPPEPGKTDAATPAAGFKVPQTEMSKTDEPASAAADSGCSSAQWALGFCPQPQKATKP